MEERFWKKVNKDGPVQGHCEHLGPCWIWMASKRNKGYGAFCYAKNGIVIHGRAHRYVWELYYGPISEGLCVLHACDTPACVNPSHLWLGTKADNNADMIQKGRKVKGGTYAAGKYKHGKHHHNARLDAEKICRIRQTYAGGITSLSKIAQEYGLATSHVYRIVKRQAWRHIA